MLAVFLGLCTALLAPFALNAVMNSLSFRPLRKVATPPAGSVSVLVAARNEEQRLAPLLESYLHLTDQLDSELVVYDDDSEDGTAALVESYAARDSRIRLVRGQGLPPGWGGKVHALHQLGQAAQKDALLFVDADVVLESGALDRSRQALDDDGLDVLSLYPQQILGSWGERIFVPVMVYYFFLFGPQWLYRLGQTVPVQPLNGQFMLWRRSSYAAIGGYAAIQNAWLDDMEMGRLVVEKGLKACYRSGVGVAKCRMYTSMAETWRGFLKHCWDCIGLPVTPYMVLHAWLFLSMVAVWLSPLTLLVRPWTPLETGLFAAVVALTALTRLPACLQGGGGWLSALLHPISMGGGVLVGLMSYVQYRNAQHTWKGRTRTS